MLNKLKNYFEDLKFRKKLLLSFAVICIIPIVILGVYCYNQAKHLLFEQEKYNIQNSLHQAAESANSQLNIYENLTSYIAFNQSVVQAVNHDYKSYYEMYESLNNVIDPLFNSVEFLHSDVKQITIYTGNNIPKHGNIVVPIETISHESWFSALGNRYDSQWIYSKGHFFNVRPIIYLNENKKTNILYLEINANKTFASFSNLIPNDYGLYIVDSNNQTVFEQNHFRNTSKSLSLKDILSLQKNPSDNYLLFFDKIEKCNCKIYFYIPSDSAVFNANSILFAVLAIIGICSIVLFFVILWLSSLLVKRIELLTQNMRQVKMGNLSVTITSQSHDEVGELIDSFGKMLNRIQTLINEVYESKLVQKEAELKALQAQINPHFLYNALSLINWKAIAVNAEDISRMTQLLSTFYRTTLNNGKQIVTVQEELANTKSYIEIQSIMHSDNFNVTYEIDEDILDFSMIKLILQPIAENAIDHGLDHKLTKERRELKIIGKLEDDKIHFTVQDNGAGIPSDKLKTILQTRSKGYGLKNVNDRIHLVYGAEYGLLIRSEIDVGTTVEILIPKNQSNLENAI